MSYPTGFVFSPTDKELFVDYLRKKVNNEPLPCNVAVKDIKWNLLTPEQMILEYEGKTQGKAWFFFSEVDSELKKRESIQIGEAGEWKVTNKKCTDDGNICFLEFRLGTTPSTPTYFDMTQYYFGRPGSRSKMTPTWALFKLENRFYRAQQPVASNQATTNPPPVIVPIPSGYRFLPRDSELLVDYLVKRINGLHPAYGCIINEVSFLDQSPDYWFRTLQYRTEDACYLFTEAQKTGNKYKRAIRGGGNGYWKNKTTKEVKKDDQVVGHKRHLFFVGQSSGETKWWLDEYYVDGSDMFLCKLYNTNKECAVE